MKKSTFILSLLLYSGFLAAQQNYKVVFDLTSKDTVDHKLVIRWMNEILNAEPTAQVEVVFYGHSTDMIVLVITLRNACLPSIPGSRWA